MVQCAMKVRFDRDFPGLGQRIKDARAEADLSVQDVAAKTGISPSQINRIQNEEVKVVPSETIKKIGDAIGVDLLGLNGVDK